MSLKTFCMDKKALMNRIDRRRQKKTYKLSPEDIETMQKFFAGIDPPYWTSLPDKHNREVFTRALQGYLESFETTETIIDGFRGRKMDLGDEDGLYYALKGRVEEAHKDDHTIAPYDASYEAVLWGTAKRKGLLDGKTLAEIGKAIPSPGFDLPFADWIHLCRALDRAVSAGQLQLQDGKYSLASAGGESKGSD